MNNEYENMKQELEEDWTVNELNFHSTQIVGRENGEAFSTAAPPPILAEPTENWTMDMSTNEIPKEETKGRWEMPEPVFRVSNGKTLDKPKTAASPLPLNLQPVRPEIAPAVAGVSNIQPQPYISEAFTADEPDDIEEPPVKTESGVGRMILIGVGILAMVLFAVGFLAGVYFLFFSHKIN